MDEPGTVEVDRNQALRQMVRHLDELLAGSRELIARCRRGKQLSRRRIPSGVRLLQDVYPGVIADNTQDLGGRQRPTIRAEEAYRHKTPRTGDPGSVRGVLCTH